MATPVGFDELTRRRNPTVRIVEWVLALVVILLVVVAVFLAVALRHTSTGQTTIFGRPVFSVASGSMAPTFDTGDLIVDQPISRSAAEHLHKGQIITFNTASLTAGRPSLVVTHRIYEVVERPERSGSQNVSYRTKGDANNAPDLDLVSPTAILGVYQQRVPFGGYVLSTLHQPITFAVLIMLPVIYLVEEEVRRRWVRLGEQEARRKGEVATRRSEPW
ncbi:MAG: signal peptidase I [Candidatus Dormibacteria bacterium]